MLIVTGAGRRSTSRGPLRLSTVPDVGTLRKLFDHLTRLTHTSKSVGEHSVAEFQRQITALRLAATDRKTAPD
jgi:hypothetical protein